MTTEYSETDHKLRGHNMQLAELLAIRRAARDLVRSAKVLDKFRMSVSHRQFGKLKRFFVK